MASKAVRWAIFKMHAKRWFRRRRTELHGIVHGWMVIRAEDSWAAQVWIDGADVSARAKTAEVSRRPGQERKGWVEMYGANPNRPPDEVVIREGMVKWNWA